MTIDPAMLRPAWGRVAVRCLAVVAAILALTTAGPGIGAADAHPFGDPQTIEITRPSDRVVQVRWRVGMEDDLGYLAVGLGLLPPDRIMLDGAMVAKPADVALLEDSPVFEDYLLEHLSVSTAGRACDGRVVDTSDVADAGATVDFTCAGPVRTADVTVSMLTDLSPAYVTVATGPDGQRAVYDGQHSVESWSFGAAAESQHLGRSAALQLTAVIGGIALAAVLAGLLWRRRRRPARHSSWPLNSQSPAASPVAALSRVPVSPAHVTPRPTPDNHSPETPQKEQS